MYELLTNLARLVNIAGQLYFYIILASVLMSWVRPDPSNPVVRFINGMTEPALDLVRRALPFLRAGMIDFSPIVLILLVQLATSLLVTVLGRLALQFA